MKASSIAAVCVAITMWRRLKRSAAIPPKGANRNTGTWLAKPTDPSSSAEPVSR